VVAFESLGVVSYLPSIVTVAVSVAVVRYLASKWCDLENRVTVRRSIQHNATIYWSAIVNIALSCTIFELFDVE